MTPLLSPAMPHEIGGGESPDTSGECHNDDNTKQTTILETRNARPVLEVETDFDDFFKTYVSHLIERKEKSGQAFQVKKIVISAGPWRPYDANVELRGDKLLIDFYSPCRFLKGPDSDDVILRAL
ncbi:MAG: hypothetical protein ACYTEU_12560 [Planctomycetota bacterium]